MLRKIDIKKRHAGFSLLECVMSLGILTTLLMISSTYIMNINRFSQEMKAKSETIDRIKAICSDASQIAVSPNESTANEASEEGIAIRSNEVKEINGLKRIEYSYEFKGEVKRIITYRYKKIT